MWLWFQNACNHVRGCGFMIFTIVCSMVGRSKRDAENKRTELPLSAESLKPSHSAVCAFFASSRAGALQLHQALTLGHRCMHR